MPRRNGTGPMGYGPMTGRGMGYCGSGAGAGYGYGMGRGFGLGRSFGYGNAFAAPASSTLLAERKRILEEELRALDAQLAKDNEA